MYVSVGYWFERLTCQELQDPSCMLESCNDDCKKFYLGHKQHVLCLSFSLYFMPTSSEVLVNNHSCSVVNWTTVILFSLLSMTYLQTNLEIIQGELRPLTRTSTSASDCQ